MFRIRHEKQRTSHKCHKEQYAAGRGKKNQQNHVGIAFDIVLCLDTFRDAISTHLYILQIFMMNENLMFGLRPKNKKESLEKPQKKQNEFSICVTQCDERTKKRQIFRCKAEKFEFHDRPLLIRFKSIRKLFSLFCFSIPISLGRLFRNKSTDIGVLCVLISKLIFARTTMPLNFFSV